MEIRKYTQEELTERQSLVGLLKENNADISNVEVRDYQLGTGDAGYNTQHKGSDSTPLTISNMILKAISHYSPIVGMVDFQMSVGAYRFVKEKTAPEAMSLVKEGAAIGLVDSEFEVIELGAYKFAEIAKLTNEAIEDVNFNLPQFVSTRLAEMFAKTLEHYIVAGTGVSQPQGLVKYVAGEQVDAAKETEIGKLATDGAKILDVVTEAYLKLPHQMRQGAVLLAHPEFVKQMAITNDANKRSLLVPDYSGELRTIFGKQIVETYELDFGTAEPGDWAGAEKVVAMWVNPKEAMVANMRSDVSLQVLTELYAENDITGIKAVGRFDSKIKYHAAISAIKTGE